MSADTLCWTDIPVTNLDRAIKFYSAVLGKEVKRLSEGGMEYGLLSHEEQSASGCLCLRSDSGGVDNRPSANGPLIYLSVEGRLDEAVEIAAQLLDVRAADKDPKKTGSESRPGCEQRAERRREQRRQTFRMLPCAHKSDELQNHDQRTRSRFREPQSVHHLTRFEPTVMKE